jgi:hypothetical protein
VRYYVAWKTDFNLNPLDDKERKFISKNKKMVYDLLANEEGMEYAGGASVICKDGTKWCVQYLGEIK